MAELKYTYKNKRQSNLFALSFVILLVLLFLFSFLLNPFIENFNSKNYKFLVLLLPFFFSILFFYLLCKKFNLISSYTFYLTSNKFISFKKILFAFFFWFLILLSLFLFKLFNHSENVFFNSDFKFYEFLELVLISIVFVLFQSFYEELLFRRYLILSLSSLSKNKYIIILFSSILFSLMHLNNPEIKNIGFIALLYYFISGIFLATISYFENGIELCTGFHFANNLFGTIIVTNKTQVFQTNAIFIDNNFQKNMWEFWLILFVLYPFCLFLYFKFFYKKNYIK